MVNERVIVIDGGNIQFIAMYASKANPNVPVEYTYLNMISGYFNKLNVTLDDEIILALDYGSWRKEIDKSYKAQRAIIAEQEKEWRAVCYKKFNNLYEKMNISLPIHQIKIYKAEADDIASVCCRYYRNKEIILISSDVDWEMLLTFSNVSIFSPRSKKFKVVLNPTKVLLEKIQGDKSDNLLTKPSSEAEFIKRKMIVDLINPLPEYIENPIKEALNKIIPKNLYPHKIPFKSMQIKFAKIYKLEK